MRVIESAEDPVWRGAAKPCSRCRRLKFLGEFHVRRASGDGRQSYCRTCNVEQHVEWKEELPERAWDSRLRSAYGISADDYREILRRQRGACGVCYGPPTARTRTGERGRYDVDHDHACCPGTKSCGKCVRGLLCGPCNRALGYLERDPEQYVGLPHWRPFFLYLEAFRCR